VDVTLTLTAAQLPSGCEYCWSASSRHQEIDGCGGTRELANRHWHPHGDSPRKTKRSPHEVKQRTPDPQPKRDIISPAPQRQAPHEDRNTQPPRSSTKRPRYRYGCNVWILTSSWRRNEHELMIFNKRSVHGMKRNDKSGPSPQAWARNIMQKWKNAICSRKDEPYPACSNNKLPARRAQRRARGDTSHAAFMKLAQIGEQFQVL
jgi:hypothetical protein